MPCRDGGWGDEEAARLEAKKQTKLDNVTRMLCELCTVIEKYHPDSAIQQSAGAIKGLRAWWDKHKKRDAKRLEKERKEEEHKALVKGALDKLTDKERKALNL